MTEQVPQTPGYRTCARDPDSSAQRDPGLIALESRLREDLERLCLPAEDWLRRPDSDPVLDVAIVGGGMSGLAAAAALRLAGVRQVRIFDRNRAGQAGPWVTHARMQTLRSPKHLVGPALGLPSLTFRAWYEAQHGIAGWEALGRIPRVLWQEYLNWYRAVLDLPVMAETSVDGIEAATLPDGSCGVAFRIQPLSAGGAQPQRLTARHLVLATGMDGLGKPAVPALAAALPRDRWQHTSESIDFSRLRGRRLGIVGGGDSALDCAATAAEAGAASVDVVIRGADFSRINYWKAFTHPGHRHGFPSLPPERRQPLLDFLKSQRVPPARDTVRRVARYQNIRLFFDSPVKSLVVLPDHAIGVCTPRGTHAVDHLLFATGYASDATARPELTTLAKHIRFWSDRLPELQAGFALQGFPDLDDAFSLREKAPGECPVLRQIHLFTGAALVSLGKISGDIPGVSEGAERLTRGIVARLYASDLEHQFQAVRDYDELEVQGHEWTGLRADAPQHYATEPVHLEIHR